MKFKSFAKMRIAGALAAFALIAIPAPAGAELILSQLVVDLGSKADQRTDIEVWNNSEERAYVAAEPSEIVDAGKPGEQRRTEPDPEKRGLLVSPNRMILEPGQRRLIRLASIGERGMAERVYRVTVKPVAGKLSSEESGLKLLIGYDVLVLLRPSATRPGLSAVRSGNRITFRNDGNASVELIDGKQCAADKSCVELPGKRIYAGAEWSQELKTAAPVDYSVVSSGKSVRRSF
jgi:P pilus assembly chaperone PapD